MKMSRKLFLASAVSLCFMTAAQSQNLKELNFGIIATEKAGALKQMWEPFLSDMSKAVGVKVSHADVFPARRPPAGGWPRARCR